MHYLYKAIKDDVIIYIGETGDMLTRMNTHRSSSEWWKHKDKILYTLVGSQREAKLLEKVFINKFTPSFNKLDNDGLPLVAIQLNIEEYEWKEYSKRDFSKPIAITTPKKKVIQVMNNNLPEKEEHWRSDKCLEFFRKNRDKVNRVRLNEHKQIQFEYTNIDNIEDHMQYLSFNIIRGSSFSQLISSAKGYYEENGSGKLTINFSEDNITYPLLREVLDIEKYEPIDDSFYYKTKYWGSIKKDYLDKFFNRCLNNDSPISLIDHETKEKFLINPSDLMKNISAVVSLSTKQVIFLYDKGRSARVIHCFDFGLDDYECWKYNYSNDLDLSTRLRERFGLKNNPKIIHFDDRSDKFVFCQSEADYWYMIYTFHQYDMRKKNSESGFIIRRSANDYDFYEQDDFFLFFDFWYKRVSFNDMKFKIEESDYIHLKIEDNANPY